MAAGYSGTPLAKKLGIPAAGRVAVVNAPEGYRVLLEPLPDGVEFVERIATDCDVVHCFTTDRAQLAGLLTRCRTAIRPDAAVWVSWPKKASRVTTDVDENVIRTVALPMGFVDVKVCAVDETWSGLKLVIRKTLRPRGR